MKDKYLPLIYNNKTFSYGQLRNISLTAAAFVLTFQQITNIIIKRGSE
jgi:hypothetical protein